MKIAQAAAAPRRRAARPARTAAASPTPTARWRATSENRARPDASSPAPRRRRRNASALGLRGHTPSRKVMIAAGRPASVLSASPLAVLHRQRTADAARGQMLHQAEEERQVAFGDALLVQRQDEGARAGVQQEVGVLDALGDALVGQQFADVVMRSGTPQARRRRRRYRPPSAALRPRRAAANAAAGRTRSLPRPRPSPHAVRSARRTRP